jgi:protein-L-isoaspartate O-methyltransferase
LTALPSAACSADAFEARYRQSPDPWDFAHSGYERQRYQTIITSLARGSYGRAFEPACSVGELTAQLAPLCEQVIATDIAPSAVARARQRCLACPNVQVSQADLAGGSPPGPFDLIVLSEVGYYFDRATLTRVARDLEGKLAQGGEMLAVHWLGHSDDHVLHGDTVHHLLGQCLSLEWIAGARHAGFRVDSWVRR